MACLYLVKCGVWSMKYVVSELFTLTATYFMPEQKLVPLYPPFHPLKINNLLSKLVHIVTWNEPN